MQDPRVYRDLDVWKQSMSLVEHCYRVTASFPSEERFGIASQLRRAAVSIPSNIAEGSCRRTTRVYANHVSIALGSHAELETCLELASRLALLSDHDRSALQDRCDSVGRLLSGLYRALGDKIKRDAERRPPSASP